eukprot:TRINITY_DN3432_c0_g1_i2.p1 TRINITY_DN3432_c0_g1~~TRINITY_DN3432_c0_g1_i2.p1  ORF type:complete len:463 (-),score=186.22 TRINITY_DN3432_c0_g1_i2:231-1619(-)
MGAFAERRPLTQSQVEHDTLQRAMALVDERAAVLGYAAVGNASVASFEAYALLYRDFHAGKFVTYRGSLGTRYDAVIDACWRAATVDLTSDQKLLCTRHEVSTMIANNRSHVTKHLFYPVEDDVSQQEQADAPPDSSSRGGVARVATRAEPLFNYTRRDGQQAASLAGWTVASYNIWNLNEPWPERLALIVEQLRADMPDIIAFQEVRYMFERRYGRPPRDGMHQIDELAAALPDYQYVFVPGMTYVEINYGTFSIVDEGVAVFSRLPIVDASSVRMSRNFADREDSHQRVCLRAEVQLPGAGTVHVFVTHMTLSDSARLRNAVEFLRFADRYPGPQVFVGDFNMNPDGEALLFLRGERQLDGLSGNFRDAWLELHPESAADVAHGWTYTTLQDEPKKRIDFVMYRGGLRVTHMHVIDNANATGLMPSDHRGLVASFTAERVWQQEDTQQATAADRQQHDEL